MTSQRKFVPPGARAVVDARAGGDWVNTVFVAMGWPSRRLKAQVAPPGHFSEAFPSIYEACFAVGVVNAAAEYLWHWVIGLDVVLWAETPVQAAQLESSVLPLLKAENPRLVQLWHMHDDARVDFLKVSTRGLNV